MPDSTTPPALSKRMRAALDVDGPPFGHPRPTKRELSAIKAVIAAKGKDEPALALGRAMRVAADADPSADTARSIAAVMNDRKQPASRRRQAAAALGEIPDRTSSQALVRALRSADPTTEFAALTSLAKVGQASAADAIAALPETDSPRLRRARDFALGAIRYRSGGDVDDDVADALMPPGSSVELEREDPQTVARAAKSLRGGRYGITVNPSLGYRFECGGRRHLLLLDRSLDRGRLVGALLERPMIAGLVAEQEEGGEGHVTSRVIFTHPRRGQVEIAVVDPQGEVRFQGALRPVATGMTLTLADHTAVPFPVLVEGVVTDNDLAVRATVYPRGAPAKDPGQVDELAR